MILYFMTLFTVKRTSKLVIEEGDWEDVWYKDEGGRDKCMQVQVGLYDNKNSLVYNRRIPLKFTLFYDTNDQHVKVTKQEILQVLGAPRQFIDPETAKTTLRFRIEDVSKNHQGQNFKVQVAADPSKVANVAPVYTPSVSVRSKRNKRQRARLETATSSHNPAVYPSPLFAPPGSRSSLQTNISAQALSASSPRGSSLQQGLQQTSDQRVAGLESVDDVSTLREAMRGVIRWTEEVVNGLYPLQWQVIGYAQFSDGTLDYNRPYHSMPNPNACISRILSMYADETREQLRVLLTAVENTHTDTDQGRDRRSGVSDVCSTVDASTTNASVDPGNFLTTESIPPEQRNNGFRPHSSSLSNTSHFTEPQVPFKTSQSMLSSSSDISPPPRFSATRYPQRTNFGLSGHDPTSSMGGNQRENQWQQYQTTPSSHHMPTSAAAAAAVAAAGQDPMNSSSLRESQEGGRRKTHSSNIDGMREEQSETNTEYDDIQREVVYVLAIQYKSPMTGKLLGFPAYSATKEILGFYRESTMKVGVGRFIPIARLEHEFGPMERSQASRCLLDAIERNSEAVYSLEDWGTVSNLVDHAMVYDWSKDMVGGSGGSSSRSSKEGRLDTYR